MWDGLKDYDVTLIIPRSPIQTLSGTVVFNDLLKMLNACDCVQIMAF